jgi:SET domain-containing protein
MYRPLPNCLTVEESSIEGLGLFATEPIPSGTVLGITHIQDKTVGGQGWIRTPLGGFYNHSDTPNCRTVNVRGEDPTEEDHLMFLVTLEDIDVGEELTSTYRLYSVK